MVEIVDQEEVAQTLMTAYGEQLPDVLFININYLPPPLARRIACLGLGIVLSRPNKEVKKQTEELAGLRPITAWTDGDLQIITPKLRRLGIGWKIISKFEMAGAEVEKVIDNLSLEEFIKLYRIKVRLLPQNQYI